MDTEGVTCCASFFSTVMCTTGAAMPPMSLTGCVMFDYVFTVSELAGLVGKSWMPRAQPTGATPEERNASSTTHEGPRMRRDSRARPTRDRARREKCPEQSPPGGGHAQGLIRPEYSPREATPRGRMCPQVTDDEDPGSHFYDTHTKSPWWRMKKIGKGKIQWLWCIQHRPVLLLSWLAVTPLCWLQDMCCYSDWLFYCVVCYYLLEGESRPL